MGAMGQMPVVLRHADWLAIFFLLLIVAYFFMRLREGGGLVPRAQTAAGGACVAFTLAALWMTYLAWSALPLIPMTHRAHLPEPLHMLETLGQMQAMPSFYGGGPYVLLTLGVGLWMAAISEGQRGEAGLARLRGVTIVMALGSIALAAVTIAAMRELSFLAAHGGV